MRRKIKETQKTIALYFVLFLATLFLAGCGGGDGGGGGRQANTPPVADAGSDRNVLKNTVVRLDAGGSSDADNDALTYQWAITSKPKGSNATLSGATTVNPTFTVDARGVYALSLAVNDGQVDSAPDFVTIQAKVFPGEQFAVEVRPFSVFVADLNGDGINDLATANGGFGGVSVLLGNGDGTFGALQLFSMGDSPRSIFVADLDGDGFEDLVTANFFSDDVSLLRAQ